MANPCPRCERNGGVTHCKSKGCPWTWCTGCNHDYSGERSKPHRTPPPPKEL